MCNIAGLYDRISIIGLFILIKEALGSTSLPTGQTSP